MSDSRDESAAVPEASGSHSRRDFLKGAVGGVAAIGTGGFAFRGSLDRARTGAAHSLRPARPRYGGRLRLASTGGSSSDTLDGQNAVNNLDFARAPQLYECLVEWDPDFRLKLGLAEEITPNASLTEWTIRVRKGVEFHNGKALSADDVMFSLQRIVDKHYVGASLLTFVDVKNMRKLDAHTVRLPMLRPFSILLETLTFPGTMSIVPVGYDPKLPVGTGAFKYKSFNPGVQSTFARNPHYWRSGEPYVDEVVITDYADEASQDNALLAGEADCVDQLSVGSIAELRRGSKVVNTWTGPGWVPFTMRVDEPPFNDARVREAMRLVIDRPLMREVVYGGHGLLGNDIFGIFDPEYDHSLPQRHQDIDRAKFLLKKAGHEKLTTTLVTAPIHTGAEGMAQVLKQQAAEAGITIDLSVLTDDAYFVNYLKWRFSQDWWDGSYYLLQQGYSMVPGAPWDETHWTKSSDFPRYYDLYKQALSTAHPAKQSELVHEMMKIDYDVGSYIIPVFNPVIAAQSTKLKGVVEQKTPAPWINYLFRTLWFE